MTLDQKIQILSTFFSFVIIIINFYLLYSNKAFKFQIVKEKHSDNSFLITIYNNGSKHFYIRNLFFDNEEQYYNLISIESSSHGDNSLSFTKAEYVEHPLPLKIESGDYFILNISQMILKYQNSDYISYLKKHTFGIKVNNKIIKLKLGRIK